MKSKKPTTSKTTPGIPAPPRTTPVDIPSVSDNLHERIARRAYKIYERRIRQGALDDWLQAERETLGQTKETQCRHAASWWIL